MPGIAGCVVLLDNQNNSESGFALAEMLCAMLVLAIASIGFFQIMSDSAFTQSRMADRYERQNLAVQIMTRHQAEAMKAGESINGEDEALGVEWTITATVMRDYRPDNAEQPALYEMVVTLSDKDAPSEDVKRYVKIVTGRTR